MKGVSMAKLSIAGSTSDEHESDIPDDAPTVPVLPAAPTDPELSRVVDDGDDEPTLRYRVQESGTWRAGGARQALVEALILTRRTMMRRAAR